MRHTPHVAALALAAMGLAAQAQSPPPPPVSPAPVVNYEYDAQGNPTKTIQAPGLLNFNTSSTYDKLDRRKDTTDAKLGVTAFEYNGREDLTKVTDPRSLVTTYPRNGLGDATQLVSPDTGTATHTYDAAGNLKTRTDSRGVLATYSYDALNRLITTLYSKSGSTSRTFSQTYDQTGNGFANGIGRLTSTAFPEGSTQYTYDPQGRLTSAKQVINKLTAANKAVVTHTTAYSYDAAGHITSITYPSGRVLSLGYLNGQLDSLGLKANAAATLVPMLSQIGWEPFGAAKSWLWQLNTGTQSHDRTYDNSGRLVRYRLGNVIRDVSYDAADRITAYTHYDASTGAASATLNQGFSYDELGRVTGITTASTNWTIGYDASGNRTSVTQGASTRAYTTATTSNRLTALSNPVLSFTHDAAGNITAGGTAAVTYSSTYSLDNRLATMTAGGVTTTYAYDTQGQRVRKYGATSASTVIFVYDQQGHLLGEYDSTGVAIREYVWLGDEPIAVFTPNGTSPPNIYYVHSDHLGAPRVVLDKSNNLRWRWMAEPFGTTAPETNPQSLGAFTFNLRLPGQFADSETGLFYNYRRDYDPSIGRYVQSDPIGLEGGINTYAYVGGNPVSYVDPNGEIAFVPVAIFIGQAVWGAYQGYKAGVEFNRLQCSNRRPDPSMNEGEGPTPGQANAWMMQSVRNGFGTYGAGGVKVVGAAAALAATRNPSGIIAGSLGFVFGTAYGDAQPCDCSGK
jgi:RHS repeat-associated protein